jgi:thioredoxin reductase
VTIFESLPVAGGMLAVCIPDYRLPKDILNWEIDNIKKLGVEIKTNVTIGKDIQLSYLQKQYKAIFIATGVHKGLKMNIEGEKLPQVIDAVDFLRAIHLGQKPEIGQKVAVIGGGDAAIDAARVAKRLGKDVQILYRRTRREMPAAKEEIEEAIKEGIGIEFLVAPIRALSENSHLKEIECVKMELGDVDSSGRRRPIPIEGSEFTVEIDTLMPAIGQQPDLTVIAGDDGLKRSKYDTIEVSPETLCSGVEGIFAGGDVVSGPNTVTAAMAHGKIAAKMIHNYIQGTPVEWEYKVTRPAMHVEAVELTDEEIEELQKPSTPMLSLEERAGNFKEVELGYTEEPRAGRVIMKLKDIERILGAEVIAGSEFLQKDIEMACGSDLMSDVLSFVKSGSLLLTGLTNPQVVRTSEMSEILAVCFVRGKRPGQETIELAESKNIALLTTPLPMFESCGRLYQEGLPGCSEHKK